MGKGKMQEIGKKSYGFDIIGYIASVVAIGIALPGCVNNAPSRFVGTLAPVGGTCDPVARALLVDYGSSIEFIPHDGVLILTGTLNRAGNIEAVRDLHGATPGPYRLTFTGKLVSDKIAGTYVTPRCRYRVTLALISG